VRTTGKLLLVPVFLLTASSAYASTLGSDYAPDAFVNNSTGYLGGTTNYFFQQATSFPFSNSFPGNPGSSGLVSGGSDPSVDAVASASGGELYVTGQSTYSASAQATLLYYFEVVGPVADQQVGAMTNYSITVSGSSTQKDDNGDVIASSSSSASLEIGDSNTGVFYTNTTPGTYNQSLTLYSDTIYFVDMLASAQAESNGGTALGHANVDPVFTLDPGYSDYSIAYSPGITQGSPSTVPIPSTWIMLLPGLAGIGFMAYRRKSKSTLMAA